jgi:hypothetical protein
MGFFDFFLIFSIQSEIPPIELQYNIAPQKYSLLFKYQREYEM